MKNQTRNIYGFYYDPDDRDILDFVESVINLPVKQIEIDEISFDYDNSRLKCKGINYNINNQDVCIFIVEDETVYEDEYRDIYHFLMDRNLLENGIIYNKFNKMFFKLKNQSIFYPTMITNEDENCNKEIIRLFLDFSNDIEIKIDHSPIAPSLDLILEDVAYPALFNSNINPILNPLGISPDLVEFL